LAADHALACPYSEVMPSTVSVKRLGYRVAFRGLQMRWAIQRPVTSGVKCVITHGDRVLLVRHTYGLRAWDLPGGGSRRGEDPVTTARREMEEELGLGDAGWYTHGRLRGTIYRRRDEINVVRADLSSPALRVDPVEIESAAWFERDRLPLWVSPFVGPVLAGVFGGGGPGADGAIAPPPTTLR
jgi:8-oxo-dGTP pyrophosphatase MutT (NUDIX family)